MERKEGIDQAQARTGDLLGFLITAVNEMSWPTRPLGLSLTSRIFQIKRNPSLKQPIKLAAFGRLKTLNNATTTTTFRRSVHTRPVKYSNGGELETVNNVIKAIKKEPPCSLITIYDLLGNRGPACRTTRKCIKISMSVEVKSIQCNVLYTIWFTYWELQPHEIYTGTCSNLWLFFLILVQGACLAFLFSPQLREARE